MAISCPEVFEVTFGVPAELDSSPRESVVRISDQRLFLGFTDHSVSEHTLDKEDWKIRITSLVMKLNT